MPRQRNSVEEHPSAPGRRVLARDVLSSPSPFLKAFRSTTRSDTRRRAGERGLMPVINCIYSAVEDLLVVRQLSRLTCPQDTTPINATTASASTTTASLPCSIRKSHCTLDRKMPATTRGLTGPDRAPAPRRSAITAGAYRRRCNEKASGSPMVGSENDDRPSR